MARYSLLIGRLDHLLIDWPQAAPGIAQAAMALFAAGILVAVILEARSRRLGRPSAH
jgi:hypothetical protein